MSEPLRRTLRQVKIAAVSTALVVLVLTGCGVGGDDDEPTATASDDGSPAISTTAPTDLTADATQIDNGSPDATEAGTPEGVTPTPSIVVSAPPVTIPTAVPTPAATPTLPDGEQDAGASPGSASLGDGTGGAPPAAEAGDLTPANGATPASTPVGVTTVSSCEVDSVPPSSDGEPVPQVTTSAVNLRTGPGTDCDVLGDPFAAGVVVTVLSAPVERTGDEFTWVAVAIDGVEGWMATEFLEPEE